MRPLDTALLGLAQLQESRTQYAFAFTSPQIPGAVWRYTSPQPVTIFGDDLYAAAVIKLADHREGADGQAATTQFQIECAQLEPFLSLLAPGLSFTFEVDIYELFFPSTGGDTGVGVDLVAHGQLIKVESDDTGFTLTFQDLAAWLPFNLPKRILATSDTRIPWADEFGLDADDFSVGDFVVLVDRNILYCAAAAAQPRDFYANAFILYSRTIAGQPVTIRVPVTTNVPEGGYLVLATAPPAIGATGSSFLLYQGYDNSAAASKALGNFYSRLVRTVRDIIAPDESPITSHAYTVGVGAIGWATETFPTGYTVDRAAGTITFTETPSLSARLDLRWDGLGFQGQPDAPFLNPVLTSQSPGKPPAGPGDSPTIDHYENTAGYHITKAAAGQTVWIIGDNFDKPNDIDPVLVNGVAPPAKGNKTYLAWGNQKIVIVVPLTATTGTIHLKTKSDFEVTGPSLTIVAAGTRFIDHVEDALGATVTSGAITEKTVIVGFGFGHTGSARRVKIGAISLASNTTGQRDWTWNDLAVTFNVPTHAGYPFTDTLTVHTGDGVDIADSSFTITGTVVPSTLISHFENDGGRVITSATAGQKIAIIGTGFGKQAGTITFNGLAVAALVKWSNTQITVKLPTPVSFPDTGPVAIVTSGGLQSSGPDFLIGAAAGTPWIDSYEDLKKNKITSGVINEKIFIIGENFGSSRGTGTVVCDSIPVFGTITVNGHITDKLGGSWSDSRLKVTLPSGTETNTPLPMHVHTDAATDTDDSATPGFTILA